MSCYLFMLPSQTSQHSAGAGSRAGNVAMATSPVSAAAAPAIADPAAPFVPFRADPSGAPASGCVFMTGGPRTYLPGLSCVVHQLHALRSAHPVVVVVPEEDAALLAPVVARNPNARLIVWNHFPHSFGGKWGHTNVLDKMNVLGAPFGRVVWLDADTFVRRNIDELCALAPNVSFAAAINAGFRARTCFDPLGKRGAAFKCQGCRHTDGTVSTSRKGAGAAAAAASDQALPACRYELNSAVMVVSPLGPEAFRQQVLEPVQANVVRSRDGGDQGAINQLLYAKKLWGDRHTVLHSRYNALARVHALRPRDWAAWNPAIVHFSRETKPWALADPKTNRSRYVSGKGGPLQREWQAACGAATTGPPAAVAGRRAAQLSGATQTPLAMTSSSPSPSPSPSSSSGPSPSSGSGPSSGEALYRSGEGRQLGEVDTGPGVTTQPVCGEEPHSDTGGAAVVFGINHRAASAQDCCDLCQAHAAKAKANGRGKRMPCNSWVFCPLAICWGLDTGWNHTYGECWLKHQPDPAHPLYGQRGAYTPEYRRRHRRVRTGAPSHVPWTGGVIGCARVPALRPHSTSTVAYVRALRLCRRPAPRLSPPGHLTTPAQPALLNYPPQPTSSAAVSPPAAGAPSTCRCAGRQAWRGCAPQAARS